MSFFNSDGGLMTPGAYLLNNKGGGWPVFFEVSYFHTGSIHMNNIFNGCIIMPGFIIKVWEDEGYKGSSQTITNYTSSGPRYQRFTDVASNTASSCRLFITEGAKTTVIKQRFGTYGHTMTKDALPYTFNGQLTFPGLYLTNGIYGCFPVFYSLKNFGSDGPYMDNCIDAFILMPGFKAIIYHKPNYFGDINTVANNTPSAIFVETSGPTNYASSCRLYFRGTEITHPDWSFT